MFLSILKTVIKTYPLEYLYAYYSVVEEQSG